MAEISASDNNVVNWASLVRNMLNTLGFGDVWLYQGVGDTELFIKAFLQRVKDNALQTWNQSMMNSSESYIYRELKTSFEYSQHLSLISQPKYRYQFVKFVTRNHKLAVVTGKWHKPRPIPYAERLCPVCNVIEDEYHVVLECIRFRQLRKRYIPSNFWQRPSMFKLVSLFSTNNANTLQNLAKYLYKITLQ